MKQLGISQRHIPSETNIEHSVTQIKYPSEQTKVIAGLVHAELQFSAFQLSGIGSASNLASLCSTAGRACLLANVCIPDRKKIK
jgi:hypothetical protein